jgi:hypothetical protein
MLKSVACEEGQGYFLSRPLDIDAFNGLLDDYCADVSGKNDSGSCQTVS